MTGPRKFVLGALLVMILVHGRPAWAQFTSAIEGTVFDPTGLVTPGATVTLANQDTGVSQTATTSGAGYYRFPALPTGRYTVKVELQGFRTSTQENIRLATAETATINVKLEVGNTAENVTVSGSAPLVETAEGRVSGLITENQVKDLPLVGRNFFNLVVLTPGVSGRAAGGGQAYSQSNADIFINEYSVSMNANGARTESNNFMVDSSTISSSQRSGVVNVTPNPEVVEEVRVAVNNFSAAYGRNGSVLVSIVTKSGNNTFRGSGTAFYTNNNLQARNDFEKQTTGFAIPDFGRTETAWGFGGPVRKDHTFFFTSGDVLRSDVAINRSGTIVTPQFINFMKGSRPNNISTMVMNSFAASFTADRNFQTAGQLLGSSCSGATPIASPVGAIPCNLPVTGEGTFNTTSPREGLQWTARLDHYLNGGKDRIFGSFNRTSVDKVLFGVPDVYPDFNTISPTNSMHFNSNWTRVLSANKLNETNFSWVRVYGNLPLNRPDIPGIQVTGIERYQTTWGPNDFVQNNFEFRDVVTWTRGAHTLKTGGEYSRGHADNEGSRVFERPIYTFNSVFDFAADSPAREDNLAIDPHTGAGVSNLLRLHRTNAVSLFAQDDWKVKPNLTLSLGLRYEQFLNIYDAAGDMTALQFTQQTGNLQNDLKTARIIDRQYPLDGGLWSGGQHTLAPRLGVAFDPTNNGKMSIRGGWGRFYERMSNQLWDSEYTNLPDFAVTSATTFDPVKPLFGIGTSQDNPYNYPRPIGLTAGLNAQGGLVNGRAKADLLDPNIGNMYSDNWFAGVQREVTRQIAVEADYIGSRGNNQYLRYNVNRFNGDLFDGTFDGLMPGVSSLLYGQAIDKSHYNGGTFALRANRGVLQFGSAYTIGKAIDFSSTITPPQRPDAFGPASQDEGPSDFDIRHKLSAYLNWTIPGPPAGIARTLAGGWQVATVLIAQSGTPFTVVCNGRSFAPIRDAAGRIVGNSGCDYNADGEGNDRPNAPAFGSLSGLSNDDFIAGIFKASDFPTPAPGTQGNVGRNTFRGPRYFNVDLSLIKSFKLPWTGSSQGAIAQFRIEAFNAFNTTNLNPPEGNLSSSLFGRSTSALAGRIVQFSGRFSF
jgi:Carboxypeptidase regulatory-like domain/TonB dependent receptor-like, beta-barrel